jgi:hypothetical protein
VLRVESQGFRMEGGGWGDGWLTVDRLKVEGLRPKSRVEVGGFET